MRVRFTPEARREIRRKRAWWNRDEASRREVEVIAAWNAIGGDGTETYR